MSPNCFFFFICSITPLNRKILTKKTEFHPAHPSSSDSTYQMVEVTRRKCKSESWGVCTRKQNMWPLLIQCRTMTNSLRWDFYCNQEGLGERLQKRCMAIFRLPKARRPRKGKFWSNTHVLFISPKIHTCKNCLPHHENVRQLYSTNDVIWLPECFEGSYCIE